MRGSSSGGIVRPPRRPAGWRATGPLPAAPADRPELWPRPGEDLCHLAGDWRILQIVGGHRWSLDDLVTAWFAAEACDVTAPGRIADLGCGIGAVLMLLAWRFPAARLLGIEAQEESVSLARRSIAWNGAEGRCAVQHGDLRQLIAAARFDLVTGTPPYIAAGAGRVPRRALQAGCHIEQRGGLEEYCGAAVRLLAPRGRFVFCHSAAQLARVDAAAAAAGLHLERRLEVVPRAGKRALFTVFLARLSAPTAAPCEVLEPLVVRDARGQRTGRFQALRAAMGMPP